MSKEIQRREKKTPQNRRAFLFICLLDIQASNLILGNDNNNNKKNVTKHWRMQIRLKTKIGFSFSDIIHWQEREREKRSAENEDHFICITTKKKRSVENQRNEREITDQ